MVENFKNLFFKNIGIRQTVIKNVFWLSLSEITPKVASAILAILIARYLGVEEFGKFSFAFSFALLFAVIIDFGFVPLTTREVARNTSLAKKYIENIIIIKVVLGIAAFGAIILALNFLNKTQEVKILVCLAGLWMIIQSFTCFFQSIFRAFEKMEYEALSKIIYSAVLFIFIICAVYLNLGAISLAQSYIFAILASFIVTCLLIRAKFTKFKIAADLPFWNNLFKEAWPFVAFTIFSVIYFQISMVILSIMDTDWAVGLYSVAFNSVVVFLIFSDIIASSILPTLSKLTDKKDLFLRLTNKLVILMLILGLFLAIILFLASPLLIKLIYGKEFMQAIPAFQIMVWILPLRFMNYLFGVSLIAANLQKKRLSAAMVCAVFSITINLILIPIFSFLGAAIAALATEVILFSFYFFFYKTAIIKNASGFSWQKIKR